MRPTDPLRIVTADPEKRCDSIGLVTCPDCDNRISDAAPACIHCGRPMSLSSRATSVSAVQRSSRPITAIPPAGPRLSPDPARELECPKCFSPDVRRLELIWVAGMSRSSERASPPQPRNVVWPGIGVLAGVVGFIGSIGSYNNPDSAGMPPAFLLLAGFGVWMLVRNRRYNRDEYPPALDRWKRGFMCSRCGATFVPANA